VQKLYNEYYDFRRNDKVNAFVVPTELLSVINDYTWSNTDIVNKNEPRKTVHASNYNILHTAIREEDTPTVKQLLEQGASANERTKSNNGIEGELPIEFAKRIVKNKTKQADLVSLLESKSKGGKRNPKKLGNTKRRTSNKKRTRKNKKQNNPKNKSMKRKKTRRSNK